MHGKKLLIYSLDFTNEPVYQRDTVLVAPQDSSVTGYNFNEADDEFTIRILYNGRVTQSGGGASKVTYTINEGRLLLPFYNLRLYNIYQRETIDFPYVFEENDNLGVLITRSSSDNSGTYYSYDIRITVRFIGELRLKCVDK